MRWLQAAVIGCGVPLVFSACGGAQKARSADRDLSQFECNDRRAEYMVAGGFVAPEAGVSIFCDDENPRLTKWHLEGDERVEQTFELGPEQFDKTWSKVDSTGWRHLDEDCANPNAADDDPAYVIDLADSRATVSLSCSGKTLPFPYDRVVNELDLRAAGFGDQDDAP